jgi:hypothetical protein
VITSCHWRSSCCVWGSLLFCVSMFLYDCFGLFYRNVQFGYQFSMSSDGKVKCASNVLSLMSRISSLVFIMLKAFDSGVVWLILFVNSLYCL